MGQKVNPIGIRPRDHEGVVLEVVCEHADLPGYVEQDHRIREFLRKKLKDASVSRIQIERSGEEGEHRDPYGSPRHRDR